MNMAREPTIPYMKERMKRFGKWVRKLTPTAKAAAAGLEEAIIII
jgi:hypothetical protein